MHGGRKEEGSEEARGWKKEALHIKLALSHSSEFLDLGSSRSDDGTHEWLRDKNLYLHHCIRARVVHAHLQGGEAGTSDSVRVTLCGGMQIRALHSKPGHFTLGSTRLVS